MIIAILIMGLIIVVVLTITAVGLLRTMDKKDPEDKQSILDRKDK